MNMPFSMLNRSTAAAMVLALVFVLTGVFGPASPALGESGASDEAEVTTADVADAQPATAPASSTDEGEAEASSAGSPAEAAAAAGLSITIVKPAAEGAETLMSGDWAEVHYVGKLENGTTFDSSRDRGQTATFRIGVGQLIKAWDLGIVGMKEGEVRKLVAPPVLAYGDRQAGSIPPGSTLYFEIELVKVYPVRTLREGKGASPQPGDRAHIRFTATMSGQEVSLTSRSTSPVMIPMGRGRAAAGLEEVLGEMKLNEQRLVTVPAEAAMGDRSVLALIPESSPIVYEVELVQISEGVSVQVNQKGAGASIQPGDVVQVHIVGRTAVNGEEPRVLFSSHRRGEPMTLQYGVGPAPVPMLYVAMRDMKPGESRTVTIPPDFAFGNEGNMQWGVAGGASMTYEIELLSVGGGDEE